MDLIELEKQARKAAHHYAMTHVKNPFKHLDGVNDLESSFYQGAMDALRYLERNSCEEDYVSKIANDFKVFVESNYGTEQNKDFYESMFYDYKQGFLWTLDHIDFDFSSL